MDHNGDQDLRELVNKLVGLNCWYVSCGGCTIPTFSLALGAMVSRPTPLGNAAQSEEFRHYEGEVGLYVWCSWRLDEPGAPLTSSEDVEANLVTQLRKLVGASIDRVAMEGPAHDLTLGFSNGLTLRVFCDHVSGEPSFDRNWELSRQDVAANIGPGAGCRIEPRVKDTAVLTH